MTYGDLEGLAKLLYPHLKSEDIAKVLIAVAQKSGPNPIIEGVRDLLKMLDDTPISPKDSAELVKEYMRLASGAKVEPELGSLHWDSGNGLHICTDREVHVTGGHLVVNKPVSDKAPDASVGPPYPNLDDLNAAAKKAMEFVSKNRDELIQAFVAKTGIQPDEAVLCEQRMVDGTLKMWVRKKGEIEKAIDQKNLGAEIWVIASDEEGKLSASEGFFTDENTAKLVCDLLDRNGYGVGYHVAIPLKKVFHGEPSESQS